MSGITKTATLFVSCILFFSCVDNLLAKYHNPLDDGNFTIIPSDDEMRTLFHKDTEYITVVFPHCGLEYSSFIVGVSNPRLLAATHHINPPNADDNSSCYRANVTIKAKNIGQSNLTFSIVYPTNDDPCKDEVRFDDDFEVKTQRYPGIELKVSPNMSVPKLYM